MTEGNDIIVKTPSITLSVKQFDLFVSWIVLYKKKKLTLISDIGETDTIFQSITSFIVETDRSLNNGKF